jgi:hypothetical protein
VTLDVNVQCCTALVVLRQAGLASCHGTVQIYPEIAGEALRCGLSATHVDTAGAKYRYGQIRCIFFADRYASFTGKVESVILQMLQTDFSLQHFPCFSLQIRNPLITHTFEGFHQCTLGSCKMPVVVLLPWKPCVVLYGTTPRKSSKYGLQATCAAILFAKFFALQCGSA